MTAPIFEVKMISDVAINVMHLEERHWYNFYIVLDKNGFRVLSDRPRYRDGVLAKHSALYFVDVARHFAETEARKCAKLD